MIRKMMMILCIILSTVLSHATSFSYFDEYADADDDDNRSNGTSSTHSDREPSEEETDHFSPTLSENNDEVVEHTNYPYVLKIIAQNMRYKVAETFDLEGTPMTVYSDEQQPIKPETIAFLKKNDIIKSDCVPKEWSAKVVMIYENKVPKPLDKLKIGNSVLFYSDIVALGDIISCANMLEVNPTKDKWRVSDKRYYIAYNPYGAFLDYHRFVERANTPPKKRFKY